MRGRRGCDKNDRLHLHRRRPAIRQPAHRAPQRHGRHHSHSAAAAALRQAFPHATLGWLIEERWAELLCTLRYPRSGRRSPQRPLVDRVHSVNTAEWRRALFSFNTWQQMAVGLSQLRGMQYDAVIDFQGAVRSALLARWSGAPVVYGRRATARECCQHVLHAKILADEWHSCCRAGACAGGSRHFQLRAFRRPWRESRVEFPVDPDAENKIASLTADVKDFVILNPGAGWGAKIGRPSVTGRLRRNSRKMDYFAGKLRAGRRRAGRSCGSRERRGGAKNLLLGF